MLNLADVTQRPEILVENAKTCRSPPPVGQVAVSQPINHILHIDDRRSFSSETFQVGGYVRVNWRSASNQPCVIKFRDECSPHNLSGEASDQPPKSHALRKADQVSFEIAILHVVVADGFQFAVLIALHEVENCDVEDAFFRNFDYFRQRFEPYDVITTKYPSKITLSPLERAKHVFFC